MCDSSSDNLLEQLKYFAENPAENMDMISTLSSRLYLKISTHDKFTREKLLDKIRKGKSQYYPLFLRLIEIAPALISVSNIIALLYESVNSKNITHKNMGLKFLTEQDATTILSKTLNQAHLKFMPEYVIYQLVWILGQLSWRDPKFLSKMRKFQYGVRTFHSLLKTPQCQHSQIFVPTLLCLKSITKSTLLTNVLVKDGIVLTIEKILTSIGCAISVKLKLMLTLIANMIKSGAFVKKMLKFGIISHLLLMFDRWQKFNSSKKYKLCPLVLGILHKIASYSKVGRSTIYMNNGCEILYKFCSECPDESQFHCLIGKIFSIFCYCSENKSLPVISNKSPLTFDLPLKDDCDDEDDEDDDESLDEEEDIVTDEIDADDEDFDDESDIETEDMTPNNISSSLPMTSVVRTRTKSIRKFSCDVNTAFEQILMFAENFKEYDVILNDKENSCDDQSTCDNYIIDVNNIPERRFLCTLATTNGQIENTPTLVRTTSRNSSNDHTNINRRSSINGISYTRSDLKVLENIKLNTKLDKVYSIIANRVRGVSKFVKLAYPDLAMLSNTENQMIPEPLYVGDNDKYLRTKMLNMMDRVRNPEKLLNQVVYDYDQLFSQTNSYNKNNSIENTSLFSDIQSLSNSDVSRIGIRDRGNSKLNFESRFECGNLRKAIQIATHEYDLILMPDINSSHHHQWFYFEVSNMESQTQYTFNLINQEKYDCQFRYGMKPLLFSVKESMYGRSQWTRCGTDITYYKNNYFNYSKRKKSKKNREFYYTLSFNIKFPHSYDVCYLAYHYPFSYTYLMANIWKLNKTLNSRTIYFRSEVLCHTLNQNEVPLITISAYDHRDNRIADREIIVLTSRVHPGESNSSWVLDGFLTYLCGDSLSAAKLRSKYVIKIVPMLNVEGVVNGCHRCGLTNEDLNRKWKNPSPILHPEIYHAKGLMEFCSKILKKTPFFFCDFHGHSKKKNIFLYGCSNQESWNENDRNVPENLAEFMMMPHLLHQCSPSFDLNSCHFKIQRAKEATARVTVWREYGVKRSYTMESTYCGSDQGANKGNHVNISHLRDMGSSVCTALAALNDETQYRIHLMKTSQHIFEDFSRSKFKYMIDDSIMAIKANKNDEDCTGEEDDEND